MGQPTEPFEYGEDCLCCWPEGETPSKVYISFEGLESCDKAPGVIPLPFNGVVAVPQSEEENCNFDRDFDGFHFTWASCLGLRSTCRQLWYYEEMFHDVKHADCKIYFENVLNCIGEHIHAEGGNATIMFHTGTNDHSIGSLLNAINMEPDPKTKFEFWPAKEGRIMVRFARKKDATNILILVEPENL